MPETVIDLNQRFTDVVGPALLANVNWVQRLENPRPFSADLTIGDTVSATRNAKIGDLSFEVLLWAYSVLLYDNDTPEKVTEKLLPVMTEALVQSLATTPIEEQHIDDLVKFMDNFNDARNSSRDQQKVDCISRVMEPMAANFVLKCELERTGP